LIKLAEEGADIRRITRSRRSRGCRRSPAEKIICVGVNYPDRNAEYKDGQDAPKYPSMLCARRDRSWGTTRPWFGRALRRSSTTRARWSSSIGKAGRHIKESAALDHIAAITLCNEGTLRDWVRHAKSTSPRQEL